MRATGDWAYVKDNSIWYRGRKDRQIKRMGKRINLDWIERQISEEIPETACSLVLEKGVQSKPNKLHLFVVDKSLSHDKLSSFKSSILKLLPVNAWPDFVHVVSHLPMTAHGKIDRGSLLVDVQKRGPLKDMSTREFLKFAWNEVLEVNEANGEQKTFTENIEKQADSFHEIKPVDVKEDDMFIACGGSSLNAVRLVDLIESFVTEQKVTKVALSELLDVILTKPFGTLCSYLDGRLANPDERKGLNSKETLHEHVEENGISPTTMTATATTFVSSQQVPVLTVKRKFSSLADATSLQDNKAARKIQGSVENDDSNKNELVSKNDIESCFCSVRRGNQWTVCEICKYIYSTLNTDSHMSDKPKTYPASQTSAQSSAISCEVVTSPIKTKTLRQSFSSAQDDYNVEEKVLITCQWQTCLYKCIDASPLVVYAPGRSDGEAFIGSHSHAFMCIRLSDGKVLWESRLGDRIESSAAVSLCGRYIIVGKVLYVLKSK